jgi:hypothetical protein
MRKTFISILSFLFFTVGLYAQHKYVGVRVCSPCHKGDKKGNISEKWQKSKHATAYKTLESAESEKIAKSKGLKKPAKESPECLECHVTAFGVPASLLDAKFDIKDGVQCEGCHGPGSDYKSNAVMKDRTKALAVGMILGSNDEKLCLKCHNKKSPTFKGFKFAEDWAKIAHPAPTGTTN